MNVWLGLTPVIGDKGLAGIYEFLQDTPKVTTLKLIKNKISDDGASILFKVDKSDEKALAKNKNIETIHLSVNQLTDVSLVALEQMKKTNKSVKRVVITANGLSTKAVKDYTKIMKDVYGVTLAV